MRMAPFWAVLPKSLFLDCGTLAATSDLLTYPISGTEFIGLSASWLRTNTCPVFQDRPCQTSANGCTPPALAGRRSPRSANNKTFPRASKSAIFNQRAVVKLTKIVAYQAESDLLALLRPHYAPLALRYVRRSEASAGGMREDYWVL